MFTNFLIYFTHILGDDVTEPNEDAEKRENNTKHVPKGLELFYYLHNSTYIDDILEADYLFCQKRY